MALITKILKPDLMNAATLAEIDFHCNAEDQWGMDEDTRRIFIDNQQRVLDELVRRGILG